MEIPAALINVAVVVDHARVSAVGAQCRRLELRRVEQRSIELVAQCRVQIVASWDIRRGASRDNLDRKIGAGVGGQCETWSQYRRQAEYLFDHIDESINYCLNGEDSALARINKYTEGYA